MRSVLNSSRILFAIAFVLLVGVFPAYIFFGAHTNAFAIPANINGQLSIPQLNLSTAVQELKLKDNRFETPDYIAGAYTGRHNNTFIIGHSTTVFQPLTQIQIGYSVNYNGDTYLVNGISVMDKNSIQMSRVLASHDRPTLVIMTCAGESLGAGDYSHRLIITAEKITP